MANRTVRVSDLSSHIGEYIEFDFSFGWGDTQMMRGYLHGLSPHADGYMDYLHISDEPKLRKGQRGIDMGGYAMAYSDSVEIIEPPR